MKRRCFNPNFVESRNYLGRGITVCERWLSFDNFLADMGEIPEGMTLDRIDNDGNYEPANCRWATRAQQCANMRTNVHLELNGMRMHIRAWARYLGMKENTIRNRLRRGLNNADALSTVVGRWK